MTFFEEDFQELVTIQLTQYEADLLNKPVNGIGGVQSLLRQLQQQLNIRTNKLTVTQEQIERIKKYRRKYGLTGGYQTRLAPIVKYLDTKGIQTLDGCLSELNKDGKLDPVELVRQVRDNNLDGF